MLTKIIFEQSCLLNIIGQFAKHRVHRNSEVLEWRTVQFYSRLDVDYSTKIDKGVLGKSFKYFFLLLLLKHIFSFSFCYSL